MAKRGRASAASKGDPQVGEERLPESPAAEVAPAEPAVKAPKKAKAAGKKAAAAAAAAAAVPKAAPPVQKQTSILDFLKVI